jgi:predicted nucleotide-binding protein
MFPRNSLHDTIKIPRTIWDNNAGQPFAIIDLAGKVGYSPTTNSFRELLRSSQRYGLTEGTWQNDITKTIALSALGSSIVAPTKDDNVNDSMRQALERPELFRDFLASINGKVIPPPDVFKSTLMKTFHLSKQDAELCYDILTKNIQELNLAQDLNGKMYLRLDKLSTVVSPVIQTLGESEETGEAAPQVTEEAPTQAKLPKQIFVAHGKNSNPLEQLEKILTKFKVAYKVAVEEPNSGRPISQKVAQLMKECGSGIFIFTADEETTDSHGKQEFRPSDNVVYELGAASVLYGNKIVIFKEEGVSFASDFRDFGYIGFEKDRLDAKAADLMLELIELGFMQLTPT